MASSPILFEVRGYALNILSIPHSARMVSRIAVCRGGSREGMCDLPHWETVAWLLLPVRPLLAMTV